MAPSSGACSPVTSESELDPASVPLDDPDTKVEASDISDGPGLGRSDAASGGSIAVASPSDGPFPVCPLSVPPASTASDPGDPEPAVSLLGGVEPASGLPLLDGFAGLTAPQPAPASTWFGESVSLPESDEHADTRSRSPEAVNGKSERPRPKHASSIVETIHQPSANSRKDSCRNHLESGQQLRKVAGRGAAVELGQQNLVERQPYGVGRPRE